jgi:serine/threonine protein kinase
LALTPGTRLGIYEITAAIGEGGMGQVFRARDTKLDRDVAIKILPEAFAHDADRLARFEREAKVLASLNHPHIAAIFGLEESDGVTALVMELVEGDDLSRRIAQGAIPLDEALPIARQIAEALEAAHEQGIIHRDLKPANIKVRPDGTVKVLDFGLAKAMDPPAGSSPSVSMSPTITTPAHLRQGYGGQAMTQAEMILGTAAYMAPEQARGKVVDKRADIWAFGAVLFEMLTGAKACGGDDWGGRQQQSQCRLGGGVGTAGLPDGDRRPAAIDVVQPSGHGAGHHRRPGRHTLRPSRVSGRPSRGRGTHGAGQHRSLDVGRHAHDPVHVRSRDRLPSRLVARRHPHRIPLESDGAR